MSSSGLQALTALRTRLSIWTGIYAPGYAPRCAPGYAPGNAPGYAPGCAPGCAPGNAPGNAPGRSPAGQVPLRFPPEHVMHVNHVPARRVARRGARRVASRAGFEPPTLDLSLQSADRNGLPPAMAAGRPQRTRVAVRISGQSCISAHGGDFKSKST